MPSPHNSVSVISRPKGRSAVAAAAYRHAAQMNNRGELTNDYSGKGKELMHAEIAIPENAPAWVRDRFGQVAFEKALDDIWAEAARKGVPISDEEAARQAWAKVSETLWNAVEDGEDRLNKFPKKAQLARSITLALPRMLSREAQIELMQGYVAEVFTAHGMIADWVLHDTGDGNPHVHLMLTMRDLEDDDWGLKNRSWNARSLRHYQRKMWADHANLMLERNGFSERIDHRSLRQQELELEPEGYNPHVAEHAELNGEVPRAKLRCAEVRKRNQAYLRAHPDHILAVVQAGRSVFAEEHVRQAFAKRLGLALEEQGGELDRLTETAMASPDLVPVISGVTALQAKEQARAPLYITLAKARMAQQLARDAKALAESKLERRLSCRATGPARCNQSNWRRRKDMVSTRDMMDLEKMLGRLHGYSHQMPSAMGGQMRSMLPPSATELLASLPRSERRALLKLIRADREKRNMAARARRGHA